MAASYSTPPSPPNITQDSPMEDNWIKSQPQDVADDRDWAEVSAQPTIEQQDAASVPSSSHGQRPKGNPCCKIQPGNADNPDPEEDDIVIVEDEEETQARTAKTIQELTNDVNRLTLENETTNRKYNQVVLRLNTCRSACKNEINEFARRLREAHEQRNVLMKQARDACKNANGDIMALEEKMLQHRKIIRLLEKTHQADLLASSTKIQTLTQQYAVLEQHYKNLTEELMGLANYYRLRIRSPPSTKNLYAGHVSISIHGEHFAFIGPLSMAIYVPSKTVTMNGKHLHEYPTHWTAKNNSTRDICEMGWGGVVVFNSQTDVFGENGQVLLDCETEVSSPAGIEGDELKACLRDVQPACRITHFALGGNQGTRCLSYIPPNDPSAAETPNPTHITEIVWSGGRKETTSALKRVWWGKDDVWVAEKVDGTYSWCDQLKGREGYYYGLTVALTNDFVGCKTIKALSMDKMDGRSWVLVFENGAVAYSQVVGFDKFQFEEWASQNFGCNFGLVEKPGGYNSVARYGRVEKVKKGDEQETSECVVL